MTGIDIDLAQVRQLSANLKEVPRHAAKNVRQAVQVTATHVKDDARDNTRDMKYLGGIPARIDYDMIGRSDSIGADIGFNKGGQGSLGNIIEYGSRYFPARGPLTHALHENEGDFVKGLLIAVEDAMRL